MPRYTYSRMYASAHSTLDVLLLWLRLLLWPWRCRSCFANLFALAFAFDFDFAFAFPLGAMATRVSWPKLKALEPRRLWHVIM